MGDNLQENVINLTNENTNLKNENTNLKNEINLKNNQLETINKEIEDKITYHSNEKNNLIQELETLRSNLNNKTKDIENINNEKNSEIAKINNELNIVKLELNEKKIEIENMIKEKHEYTTDHELKIKSLNDEISILITSLETYKTTLLKNESQNEELLKIINQHKTEIIDLERKLEEKSKWDIDYVLQKSLFDESYNIFKPMMIFYDNLSLFEKTKLSNNNLYIDTYNNLLKTGLKQTTESLLKNMKNDITKFINNTIIKLVDETDKITKRIDQYTNEMNSEAEIYESVVDECNEPLKKMITNKSDEIKCWKKVLKSLNHDIIEDDCHISA